jgi:4-diphosphocytidyl-2-C-methyl-D-erythritol kinase
VTGTENEIWRAFAKVNLELRVLGERPDGYHEIRTVLQTIDLYDEIRISPAKRFEFTASHGPGGDSNFVVRAVRAFEEATSIEVALRMELIKRIPSGAGLGGGSSDAATTLLGLDRRFGTRLPGERLFSILETLGSDVPFFSVGGRALAVGRGERLFPLDDEADYWLVLVNPGLSIDTAEAYSWLTKSASFNNMLSFCARFVSPHRDAELVLETGPNDFETQVFRKFPELAEIKRKLLGSGARFASLSGSGATLYGQFSAESDARKAILELERELDVSLTRPVKRSEYFREMFNN